MEFTSRQPWRDHKPVQRTRRGLDHHRGVVRFLIDECLTVDLVSVAGQFAPDSPVEGDGFELGPRPTMSSVHPGARTRRTPLS